MALRVATDIGGTFTDLVYLDEESGKFGLAKTSSTPGTFERGIMDALDKADLDAAAVSQFVHGTTVVINAITERRGVVVGLLTTRGMRDVLEIGRGNRPDIYNLRYRKPPPFVPRNLRLEVRERLNPDGAVVEPLDEEDVLRAADTFRVSGVQAVAICFLHAYANPAHEQQAGRLIAQVLPDVYVSCSHEITREWREYERTNTAVLNSYVGPIAERYLETLERSLTARGIRGQFHIMQSNAGTSTFERARRVPINLVESGPAGGVIGAAELGKAIGIDNMITIDIGGTTAKTALIEDGRVAVTTEYRLEWTQKWAGYPVKIPVVDIVEIGAGGGSIAWIDDDGALRVGPRSAGADPGPAAYGRPGGEQPTVTDANLLAGRLNPLNFLGGEMPLDVERARAALTCLARRVGVSVQDAASGILRLANANMINAIKLISVQRGYDPRDFALVAMGGGGPVHAAYLARELKIGRVVIPVAPGHFSAFGMLTTDVRRDYIRTRVMRTDQVAPGEIEGVFIEMEEAAMQEAAEDGLPAQRLRLERSADMRYRGQEHTVHVLLPAGTLDDAALRALEERFHAAHQRQYTFRLDSPIELVNLRLAAFGHVPKPALPRLDSAGTANTVNAARPVWFEDGGTFQTAVYDRADLAPGVRIDGPAIVEESAATTVLYPGMTLTVDAPGNLLIATGV